MKSHNPPLAIVTGASSGIGRETAILLARRGYRVVLIARHGDTLNALAAELPNDPITLPMDLTDMGAIEPAMANLLHTHGVPRVVINNAGTGQYAPFLDITAADERQMFDLLYHAPAATIRALLPAMLKSGGVVINICSMSTRMGPWGHSSYAAAKAALVSLTQTLAAEHDGSGVRFSYVNPGIVRTAFFDGPETQHIIKTQVKRVISPQTVAHTIVGLLDRPRLEACVPASYRFIDAIKAISPSWAHRLVASMSRPHET